jgi:sporulation protein YlmC with PRC-barrel domain
MVPNVPWIDRPTMARLLTATPTKVLSTSTLSGYRVRSVENEDLGTIEEIMIDPADGRIAYAVLCFGGLTGFGDRLYAVPWSLLRLNPADRVLILDWDRKHLEGAPAFDQDEWPDLNDECWERAIHEYYGMRPLRVYQH